MHQTNYRRRLFLGLTALFLLSLALFVVALVVSPRSGSLAFEGAKLLPQVGLVAVGGAIVSYLAFEYQQGSQRAEARQTLLRNTLASATAAYLDAKRTRRRTRATGIVVTDGGRSVLVAEYDARMAEIVDVELRFEQLVQDVASAEEAFGDVEGCVRSLRTIERALHHVISEFETSRREMGGATYPLDALPEFRRLVARQADEEDEYDRGFARVTSAVWELRRSIRSDLREGMARTPTGGRSALSPRATEGRYYVRRTGGDGATGRSPGPGAAAGRGSAPE